MSDAAFADLDALYRFLWEQHAHASRTQFGVSCRAILDQVAGNWFADERNYDGRWAVLERHGCHRGRILDLAAGCGTFVLYGLRQGYDVTGVEPEDWKRTYFREKVRLAGHPGEWSSRLVEAVGERLPFADASFDFITSYQTLEHVQDVKATLGEMLRVLRPGGVLYLRAPDYNCFFEPHYGLPFLPQMPRGLARAWLRLLRRPTAGLDTLNWTTTPGVLRALRASGYRLGVASNRGMIIRDKFARSVAPRVPAWLQPVARGLFTALAWTFFHLRDLAWIGRRERFIDLWITRLP